MTQTTYRSHQTTLERVMGALNVLPKFVLRLPFQTPMSRRLILLSYTGRKTGRSYTIPVSYVEQGDALLIPGGGGNWKWNVRDGQPVRIRLRGRDVLARPQLIKDSDEIERLLAVMTAANPTISAFVGIPKGPDGRLDGGRLETAVRYGFRIVRWHLEEGAARNQATSETSSAARPAPRSRQPSLFSLLVIDFVLFASGAVAHMGVPIPLGFGTWNEPFLVPAAIVEGVGALALGATLVSLVVRATWSRLAWWALWYCFAGVLWGMSRLALGSILAAHTLSNDFLHIAMTLLTTLALVRLASLRD